MNKFNLELFKKIIAITKNLKNNGDNIVGINDCIINLYRILKDFEIIRVKYKDILLPNRAILNNIINNLFKLKLKDNRLNNYIIKIFIIYFILIYNNLNKLKVKLFYKKFKNFLKYQKLNRKIKAKIYFSLIIFFINNKKYRDSNRIIQYIYRKDKIRDYFLEHHKAKLYFFELYNYYFISIIHITKEELNEKIDYIKEKKIGISNDLLAIFYSNISKKIYKVDYLNNQLKLIKRQTNRSSQIVSLLNNKDDMIILYNEIFSEVKNNFIKNNDYVDLLNRFVDRYHDNNLKIDILKEIFGEKDLLNKKLVYHCKKESHFKNKHNNNLIKISDYNLNYLKLFEQFCADNMKKTIIHVKYKTLSLYNEKPIIIFMEINNDNNPPVIKLGYKNNVHKIIQEHFEFIDFITIVNDIHVFDKFYIEFEDVNNLTFYELLKYVFLYSIIIEDRDESNMNMIVNSYRNTLINIFTVTIKSEKFSVLVYLKTKQIIKIILYLEKENLYFSIRLELDSDFFNKFFLENKSNKFSYFSLKNKYKNSEDRVIQNIINMLVKRVISFVNYIEKMHNKSFIKLQNICSNNFYVNIKTIDKTDTFFVCISEYIESKIVIYTCLHHNKMVQYFKNNFSIDELINNKGIIDFNINLKHKIRFLSYFDRKINFRIKEESINILESQVNVNNTNETNQVVNYELIISSFNENILFTLYIPNKHRYFDKYIVILVSVYYKPLLIKINKFSINNSYIKTVFLFTINYIIWQNINYHYDYSKDKKISEYEYINLKYNLIKEIMSEKYKKFMHNYVNKYKNTTKKNNILSFEAEVKFKL